MTQLAQLWRKRFGQLLNEVGKYGRLIFNDHFSIILFVILGFAGLFYRDQLTRLQNLDVVLIRLPIILFSVVILGVCFQVGRPILLTKDPDKSYLFAQGKEWHRYWLRGTLLGLSLPVLILVGATALLMPFIQLVTLWQATHLIYLVLFVILFKVLSFLLLYLNIFDLGLGRIQQPFNQWHHTVIFCGVMLISFFMTVSPWHLLTLLGVNVLLVIYVAWAFSQRQQRPVQFQYVLDQEATRESTFYKWVAIFADVPHLVPSVKRRAYLDGLVHWISQRLLNRYSFVYLRLLFRNNAFSGVWLRVMSFIALLLLLVDQVYFAIGLGVVGYVLTIVQLVPLIHYYDAHPLQRLYPNRDASKVKAFQQTMLVIFVIQTIVFTIAWGFVQSLTLNLVLAVFIWFFTILIIIYLYIPMWNRKQTTTY